MPKQIAPSNSTLAMTSPLYMLGGEGNGGDDVAPTQAAKKVKMSTRVCELCKAQPEARGSLGHIHP